MMARYIDANLIQYKDLPFSANDKVGVYVGYSSKSQIDAIPTADVAEAKHGKWDVVADYDASLEYGVCSVCGGTAVCDEYCGKCGAKMDGGDVG